MSPAGKPTPGLLGTPAQPWHRAEAWSKWLKGLLASQSLGAETSLSHLAVYRISNAQLILPVWFLVPHYPLPFRWWEDRMEGNMTPISPVIAPKEPGNLSTGASITPTESVS